MFPSFGSSPPQQDSPARQRCQRRPSGQRAVPPGPGPRPNHLRIPVAGTSALQFLQLIEIRPSPEDVPVLKLVRRSGQGVAPGHYRGIGDRDEGSVGRPGPQQEETDRIHLTGRLPADENPGRGKNPGQQDAQSKREDQNARKSYESHDIPRRRRLQKAFHARCAASRRMSHQR